LPVLNGHPAELLDLPRLSAQRIDRAVGSRADLQRPQVRGDALAVMEQLDRALGDARPQLLPQQRWWSPTT
jgi:hypothetical protein